ncbi:hypothetical protein CTI12_AA090850 [Artemisia annua]|uniref:Uncharacterized protein n=1 Tax=Artemisia annua TaxID=35608 RepID=A0A2U1PRS1_ARTAN|nr:hypothetical protein CTI12_AA090850 [Artemisia annua]
MDYYFYDNWRDMSDNICNFDTVSGIPDNFRECLKDESDQQNKYSKPMPWIGIYIAVASLFCILAMVADLIHGLRNRRLWFPCKIFTLNAASLTVIAVAMKLPVDLSNPMLGVADQVAKIGSMAFMCTMMANLLPSLATMNGKELLTNIIALDILVITSIVNVCIQIKTGVIEVLSYLGYVLLYVAMLLSLLIIHTCSGLTILKSKHIMELKYQAGHETALKDLELQQPGRLTVEKLKQHVKTHWIMAGTGSPQFITACSATTSASGVICVFSTVIHVLMLSIHISFRSLGRCARGCRSDYKWSITVILIIQFIGSLVGTIAPLCRCYAALSFKLSIKWIWNHIKVLKVESYWTQMLYDWKHSSIPFSVSSRKIKIVIQNFKWFEAMFSASSIVMGQNPEQQENFNDQLRRYVLQLQDDMELSERTFKSISKSANGLIKKAEKRQPNNLVRLLRESKGFEGVGKYDSLHVPPIFAEDYLDCWSLPLVTLTAIAVSLPKIQNNVVDRLLSSVSEGLTYVKLVEESLNATDEYVSIQKAAKVLWLEVEVSNKWVGNNLKNHAPEVNTAGLILQWRRILGCYNTYVKLVEESLNATDEYVSIQKAAKVLWLEVEVSNKWVGDNLKNHAPEVNTAGLILQWFKNTAKNIVTEVQLIDIRSANDNSMYRSICANSMYRITESILLSDHTNIDELSQEDLFTELSSMIADILAACLTNLPQVIVTKCHESVIEKRESSVNATVQLLGETTQIINNLQDRELPDLDAAELPFIDKWRDYFTRPSS